MVYTGKEGKERQLESDYLLELHSLLFLLRRIST